MLAIVIVAAGLSSLRLWSIRSIEVAPDSTTLVLQFLESRRVRDVYVHYWVAYKLAWEAHETVIAASDVGRDPPMEHRRHVCHHGGIRDVSPHRARHASLQRGDHLACQSPHRIQRGQRGPLRGHHPRENRRAGGTGPRWLRVPLGDYVRSVC